MSCIKSLPGGDDEEDDEEEGDISRVDSVGLEEELEREEEETSDETDDATKPEVAEKKKKKKRLARLRRKSIAVRAYQFTVAGHDMIGMLFLEIRKITDLPPERNSKPRIGGDWEDCIPS